MKSGKKLLILSMLLAGCGGGGGKRLDGAGSSFIDPLMQEWTITWYRQTGTKINYQSRGSGAGIEMMTGKEVDFGCSDAPLNDEQLAKCRANGGEVVHVPLVLGGVVPAYNLPGNPQLRFSGDVLARIYLREITRWNDAALRELNPKVELPDLDIAVVHRSDSSGSTYIWTDYLAKVWPAWRKVGVGTAVEWPCGVGQKGNDGVAGYVQRTAGALGYIELLYALQNQISYGAVQNRAHRFVRADMKSVTAAAAGVLTRGADATPLARDDLRFSLTNPPGADAYPISGTTWAIIYIRQPPGQARLLVDFLRWVTHEGQKYAEELHYAPLPAGLVHRVDEKLNKIQ